MDFLERIFSLSPDGGIWRNRSPAARRDRVRACCGSVAVQRNSSEELDWGQTRVALN